MRRPDDKEPEPEGGRAAARLRQMLQSHFGDELPPGVRLPPGSDTAERPAAEKPPAKPDAPA